MSRVELRTINASRKIRVDTDAGKMFGVPVITAGMTLTSGGGRAPFRIDDVSLQQIATAINGNPAGVKMRQTHPSESDDIALRVAYLSRAKVSGGRVLADVDFLDPADPAARRLMAMADRDPTGLGLSIVSDTCEWVDDCLRLTSITAVDFVGSPAANPTGLLSQAKKETTAMNHSPAQLEYLMAQGLPEGSTDADITAFIDTLTDDQRAELDRLGNQEAPAAAPPSNVAASASFTGEFERERVHGIMLAAQLGNLSLTEATAFTNNPQANQATVLEHLRERKAQDWKPLAMSVTLGTDNNRDTLQPAITDALALRLGRAPKKLHPRVDQFRGRTLIEMGRVFLSANGVSNADTMMASQVAATVMRPGAVSLGQSTSDFPQLLADALGKSLAMAYEEHPTTWTSWAGRRTAPDFKQIKVANLHSMPTPIEIPEGEEYTTCRWPSPGPSTACEPTASPPR